MDGTTSSQHEDCSATLRDCELGKVCVVADGCVAAHRVCRFFRFFFVFFSIFFGFETYLSPGTFPTRLSWKPPVFVERLDLTSLGADLLGLLLAVNYGQVRLCR